MARPSSVNPLYPFTAGMLEGRGSLRFNYPILTASDEDLVQLFHEQFGGTVVQIHKPNGKHIIHHSWKIEDNDAMVEFAEKIGPWSIRHRPRAYSMISSVGKKPNFEPDETPY